MISAAAAMQSAPNFAFAADISTAGRVVHLTGRFSAPDRVDEIVTVPGGAPVELVFGGGRAFHKAPDTGKWLSEAAPSTLNGTDPRAAFGALKDSKDLAVTAKGAGSDYAFTLGAKDAALLAGSSARGVSGDVKIAGGTMNDLTYRVDDGHNTTIHIAYSSIGQSPPVTTPAPA